MLTGGGPIIRSAVCLSVLVVAFGLAATASAHTIKHSGAVVGSNNTTISLTVHVTEGKVTVIDPFRFSNLVLHCPRFAVPVSNHAQEPLRVKRGKFRSSHIQRREGATSVTHYEGRVSSDGGRVIGSIELTRTFDDGGACSAGVRFRTGPA